MQQTEKAKKSCALRRGREKIQKAAKMVKEGY